MKFSKYLLLTIGLVGISLFLLYRNLADIGLCSQISILNDGTKFCDSTIGWSDYMWPIFKFSIALTVVGILTLVRAVALRALFIFSAVAAIGTAIAVCFAPEISSDFLFPLDKKNVGMLLAWGYGIVGVIIWVWGFWKSRKTSQLS